MKVLYAASEVAGFAKTGGLADVAGSLPAALAARGHDCAVVMPLYRACRLGKQPLTATGRRIRVPIGDGVVEGNIWRSTLPGSDVPVYLIEQPNYFERDDPALGKGLYQYTEDQGQKLDYPDNCARFGFFSRAILEMIQALNLWPDLLHLNDWQSGLTAVYLRELYHQQGPRDLRTRYDQMRTVFTVHNLAYQGLFWHLDMPLLRLPWRLFDYEKLEFYGKINFLKGGIVYADMITTVSPTYAREIQTPYYGCGLHGVLRQRTQRLHGIVNGIDDLVWNPAIDPHLAWRYDATTVAEGKAHCKDALQAQFDLERNPRTPLLGIVSRLAVQKGFDLLEKALPAFLDQSVQLIVLGDGDKVYRDILLNLQRKYPRHMGLHLGQNEVLAHQIEAGVDVFLMPSQYEPCGLNQLYSLRYGTLPVVRATGGLVDTVVDATPQNLANGTATGFRFVTYSPRALGEAIERCLALYRSEPQAWRQLQQTGMHQDWSWRHSAAEYERLYHEVTQQI